MNKLWNIYIGQVNETQSLTYNFPSVYNLLPNNPEIFRPLGIVFTISILGIIAMYILCNNKKNDDIKIIELAILLVIVTTYFMPGMHDRYMFIADILSIIYFICTKKVFVAIGINLMSFNSYVLYLFGYSLFDFKLAAIVQLAIIISMLNKILNESKIQAHIVN